MEINQKFVLHTSSIFNAFIVVEFHPVLCQTGRWFSKTVRCLPTKGESLAHCTLVAFDPEHVISETHMWSNFRLMLVMEQLAEHWKLSHRENVSRMRLKLVPNLTFDPHTEASNLRDNTASVVWFCCSCWYSCGFAAFDASTACMAGWLSRSGADATELSPLSHLSAAALPASDEDEDALPEDDAESGGKEKLLLTQECELVTLMSRVKGRLDVTNTHIAFYDLSPLREDSDRQDFKHQGNTCAGITNGNPKSFESSQTRNKVFTRILSLRPPNLVLSNTRSPAELLRVSGLTQKWVGREISNFEYLMQLNTIAGRTYNDLSQYPVFPWILADYTSPTLNLEDPATFRDLSRPVGVVNPKNETEVRAKYDSFEDPSGTIAKFHYGTHYSNSAGVLHYLVRVEPFTSLHIELQSGRFDVADRQFHSIPQTWKLLMDNPNDVKELTPEFFYFPEFLVNHNKFDLGLLQGTKDRVTDVVLPAWADSPEDFIQKHRQALESEHVSAHLHEWIDLIFGWRQRGPPAVEALNVFYYCSYEGATPSQLLRESHPQRLSANEALYRQLRGELRKPDLTLHLDKLRSCAVSTDRDPLVFVSCPRSPPRPAQRLFLPAGTPDSLISVSRSGALGLHAWIPHDRSASRGFSLDTDGSINNAKRGDVRGDRPLWLVLDHRLQRHYLRHLGRLRALWLLRRMINNFGQTPSQLLRESHPQRLSANEALYRQLRGELRKPDLTLHLDKLRSCA
ncbi:hypothetical protein B566_EDAN012523, partial [Ephemera danica]